MTPVGRTAAWIVARPWWWVALSAALLVAALIGLRSVSMTPDLRVFFSDDNADRIVLDRFEDAFVREETGLIAVEAVDGDVFTRPVMAAIGEMVREAWLLPFVRRVDSITNFQDSSSVDDTLYVSDLVPDPAAVTDEALALARLRARERIEFAGTFLGENDGMTLVRVLFVLPGVDKAAEVPRAQAALRALMDRIEAAHPAVALHLSGSVPMNATFMEAGRADLRTLTPAVLVATLAVAALALQMVSAVAIILAVIVVSALWSVSVLALLGAPLNSGTTAAPLVVMALTVASTVHLMAAVRGAMARSAAHDRAARTVWAREALETCFTGVTFASLTTMLGFLSLQFSISPPFQQLGVAVATGVFCTWLLSFTLLPALVVLLPLRGGARPAVMQIAAARLAAWLSRHRRLAAIAVLLAAIPAIGGLSRLELEDDFVNYFDDSFAFRRDTILIEDRLTGVGNLEFPVWTGEPGGVLEPELLSQIDAFAGWLRGQPKVAAVITPTDTLKRITMNLHGDAPDWYRLPATRAESAQYLLLYEMSLGYGMDLNDRIAVDKSALRLTAVLADVSTSDIRALEARAERWLRDHAPLISTTPTGLSHVFTLISQRDGRAMIVGTLVAFLTISALMALVLRDWRLGLISLAPNLIPSATAFGLWGWLSGDVTLAVSVVTAMTFGIVVDDTIHMLVDYRRSMRAGATPAAAASTMVARTGGAVIVTSLALLSGFTVLAFSSFAVNGDLALLTAITIAVALAADLLLLPALLVAFDAPARRPTVAPQDGAAPASALPHRP